MIVYPMAESLFDCICSCVLMACRWPNLDHMQNSNLMIHEYLLIQDMQNKHVCFKILIFFMCFLHVLTNPGSQPIAEPFNKIASRRG